MIARSVGEAPPLRANALLILGKEAVTQNVGWTALPR